MYPCQVPSDPIIILHLTHNNLVIFRDTIPPIRYIGTRTYDYNTPEPNAQPTLHTTQALTTLPERSSAILDLTVDRLTYFYAPLPLSHT
jgi:hypothetical protein